MTATVYKLSSSFVNPFHYLQSAPHVGYYPWFGCCDTHGVDVCWVLDGSSFYFTVPIHFFRSFRVWLLSVISTQVEHKWLPFGFVLQ